MDLLGELVCVKCVRYCFLLIWKTLMGGVSFFYRPCGLFVLLFVSIVGCASAQPGLRVRKINSLHDSLAVIERTYHGQIGVCYLDFFSGKTFSYRAKTRFPLCSTSKVLLVAAILKDAQQGVISLFDTIHYSKADLLSYAPVTRLHVAEGMSVSQLCEAAIEYSDNTAANLLIKSLGGLDKVNGFAKSIADTTFRLDRHEPELNSAVPGDDRDTSTPEMMARDLHEILFGQVLGDSCQELLKRWMIRNTTGDKAIRGGVPHCGMHGAFYTVGDKTGSGGYGSLNDVGFIVDGQRVKIITVYCHRFVDRKGFPADVIAHITNLLFCCLNESTI